MHVLKKPSLSIIGARNASLNRCNYAERISREFGEQGYVVISGMAQGIDRSAHQAALIVGTRALSGNGIDIPYPSQNSDIYQAIKQSSLILSEMPFGQNLAARFFPQRNRIIAVLSDGCPVIEATFKSGSLITASQSADRNIPVMAIPESLFDPRAQGCNQLISDETYLLQLVSEII